MRTLHAQEAGLAGFVPGTGAAALFLHGYGSHEDGLTSLARWLPEGLPWASLRAPLALPHGGNAWFPITTPGHPDPVPVAEATDAIWEWADERLGAETRLIPIGFSQGGLMATQLLRTRPGRIATTVVLGGFVQAAEQPGDATLAEDRPPVFWGRGNEDRVIASAAITRTQEWLPAHATLTERVYPGLAHSISPDELDDVRAFLLGV